MADLVIEGLSAFYGKAQALHDVSLSVAKGEIIAVVGANGAGKSTLLDSVMGLTAQKGAIRVGGAETRGKSTADVVRMGVGYAPERFNLFPYMSVRDNLLVGAYTNRSEIEANLEKVFTLFPRLRERQGQETSTQSGGERQMVSLGRALMSSPTLLMVDEPTIGLAPRVCDEIGEALKRLRDDMGATVVITEQNTHFALTLADRVYVLEAGAVRIEGTAEDLSKDDRLAEAYFGH